ncbi:hypothetical protein C9I49_24895 [Pseudomonas prosekii]|uniref:Uncharacterized protein n=1 Tax=Pseudomonas prosekii TaxID=1148509 RepID=A0A2U2D1T2_9PSED|nr:hypothetical protein C9I49_24895 [Pseudomonas prosekii]
MEWKGLNKTVNAEGTKGYHASAAKMMTNLNSGETIPLSAGLGLAGFRSVCRAPCSSCRRLRPSAQRSQLDKPA